MAYGSAAVSHHSGGPGIRKEVLVKVVCQSRRKKARQWCEKVQGTATTEGQYTYVKLKKCDTKAKCSGCADCYHTTDDTSWY